MKSTFTVALERRPATVTINKHESLIHRLDEGTYDCFVLFGPFQIADGMEEAYPVFVVELLNGRVLSIYVEHVVFKDVDNATGCY